MSETDIAALLSGIDLFAGLSRRQLKQFSARAKEVWHEPGHVVNQEGRPGLGFHLILEGRATVTQGGAVLRTLGPGDHFGEISMIDGGRRSATVTAETRLRAVTVSHATFEELLEADPSFARGLLLVLCARLRETERREPAASG